MSRISMQSANASSQLAHLNWKVAFVGQQVDDRGKAAVAHVAECSQRTVLVEYDPRAVEIKLDGQPVSLGVLDSVVGEAGEPLVLEATTLGFMEVFLLCKSLRDVGGTRLHILYTEPNSYRVPRRAHVLHRRDFELSDVVEDFSAVPGAAVLLDSGEPTRAVFLLGYEGQRLEQALEQTNVRPSECAVVMGVPAFQAGWEMDTFANNVRILKEKQIRELLFTGAQNPAGSYDALYRVMQSCAIHQRLIIGPIGTKPHGIGAAVFAVDFPEVGLVYDHPVRSRGRSEHIATWHLFDVAFS